MPLIQNQPLPNRRLRKLLLLIALVLVLLATATLWMQIKLSDSDRVGTEGKHLGGEYSSYQGKVYMDIAFQGYYILPQADVASFESLSLGGAALGKDKNAVYCGSRVIPGLAPQQIAFVSDGYISDGHNAWFCSVEKPNPDYHWWQMFTRSSD
jgi:hypothetical protein